MSLADLFLIAGSLVSASAGIVPGYRVTRGLYEHRPVYVENPSLARTLSFPPGHARTFGKYGLITSVVLGVGAASWPVSMAILHDCADHPMAKSIKGPYSAGIHPMGIFPIFFAGGFLLGGVAFMTPIGLRATMRLVSR